MKKRINGKTYNTDTAEHVAHWDNVDGVAITDITDPRAKTTNLYRRRDGEYFMLFKRKENWSGDIVPVTNLEARNFCYKDDQLRDWTTADLDKEFGRLEDLTEEAAKSAELARKEEADLYQMRDVLQEKYPQLSSYAETNGINCCKALELAIRKLVDENVNK